MMKKITTYLMIAVMAFGVTSCLEKYPEDAVLADEAINTVEEADQLVIGIYSAFQSPALYSGNLTLLPDLQADFVYAVEGYSNTYGDIWRGEILSTNGQIASVYSALYYIVGQCNFFLEYAPRVAANTTDDAKLEKLDQLYGEVYLARALAYSELIKMYCKSYESESDAANELGVVLISKYESDEPVKRASLKESYEFVLSDLKKAEELLVLEEDYNPSIHGPLYSSYYFNEYVAYALHARIALYMKDYDAAIEYATKVIDSGYYSLSSASDIYTNGQSYYQYMWSHDLSTESIWQVGFTINSYGAPLGQIFWNYDYRSYRPDYVPAQWVLDLYGNNDLRYISFFQELPTGYTHGLVWPLLVKYWGNEEFLSYNILHTCMPKVFRLSEQYLIRAEAYAQQGDYNKAGKDISSLRKARYRSYSSGTSMNADNAMDIVEEERVKELYMEGFRLMDLKRWHKGFEREPQTHTLSNGNRLKVEKDDPSFVWPIPQHELEAPGADIEPNESNK